MRHLKERARRHVSALWEKCISNETGVERVVGRACSKIQQYSGALQKSTAGQ